MLVIVTGMRMQAYPSPWSIGFFFGSLLSFAMWVFTALQRTTPVEIISEPLYPDTPDAMDYNFDAPLEIWDQSRGENYPKVKRVRPPVPPKKMRRVANKYQAVGKFTGGSMYGPGKPLTRNEFENLRDYMIKNRLAKEDNPGVPNTTISLTHWGENMMKAYGKSRGAHAHTRRAHESEA